MNPVCSDAVRSWASFSSVEQITECCSVMSISVFEKDSFYLLPSLENNHIMLFILFLLPSSETITECCSVLSIFWSPKAVRSRAFCIWYHSQEKTTECCSFVKITVSVEQNTSILSLKRIRCIFYNECCLFVSISSLFAVSVFDTLNLLPLHIPYKVRVMTLLPTVQRARLQDTNDTVSGNLSLQQANRFVLSVYAATPFLRLTFWTVSSHYSNGK